MGRIILTQDTQEGLALDAARLVGPHADVEPGVRGADVRDEQVAGFEYLHPAGDLHQLGFYEWPVSGGRWQVAGSGYWQAGQFGVSSTHCTLGRD